MINFSLSRSLALSLSPSWCLPFFPMASLHSQKANGDTCDSAQVSKKPRLSLSPLFITDSDIRSEFAHHDHAVARLNNGSFGCCPASVSAAQAQWQLRFLRQPDHFYFNQLQPGILRSRTLIKELVNADEVDEISLVDNATTAVAIVLQRTAWAFSEGRYCRGDAAVMLHYAYGAVKKSIGAYVARSGGYVIEVQLPFPVNSNEEIVNEFKKALERGKSGGRKVRLAVIDHVTSMPSVVIPVKELVKICRDEGVEQIFVDAAHGIGCTDVDMKDIGADFYTSNLHKWFFCPPSVAFLYCRKSPAMAAAADSDLHHPVVSHEYGNGLAIESAWIGTRDYSAQLVVPSAFEFVNRFEGGIDGIKRRNHEAVVEMGEMLAKAWGTNLGSPPEMCASMIMVGLPACLGILSEADTLKLRTHLRDRFGVEVPIYYRQNGGEIGLVTGYARISHEVYNTIDDYFKFREAINKLVHDEFTCALLPN
ncbi:probable L-cysteine desulfhydrase, chloroplastic [Malania oleifera]|uniref:probable L-cysteine desulfhydrase, chloroplastic n=1 Tax=Malania oleifera TaxID=397392 RepID=UPI0025AE94E7|nr:probable L-cysteine desulfhydrase, chloroplastic [Malania oleifera]XP_057963153.1 probable L-cysteine desulfhydrase, chloroplastic [Malania oleifera]XP_057963154.1 probable L-cysteine desulfhydrase, chloroplastic [Malania oleifera]XP_057963155.1 probable L-cysteine desulfhydrase, chloroplastic [Malania oleifera]